MRAIRSILLVEQRKLDDHCQRRRFWVQHDEHCPFIKSDTSQRIVNSAKAGASPHAARKIRLFVDIVVLAFLSTFIGVMTIITQRVSDLPPASLQRHERQFDWGTNVKLMRYIHAFRAAFPFAMQNGEHTARLAVRTQRCRSRSSPLQTDAGTKRMPHRTAERWRNRR